MATSITPSHAPSMRWNVFKWPPESRIAMQTEIPSSRAFSVEAFKTRSACSVVICMSVLLFSVPLKLRESSMHQAHGRRSFANGRSHPLDASSADVAHSENSREAGLQYVGRTGERPG